MLIGTAKQSPWPPAMIAVLTPTTRRRSSTSGPPELPGLSAASVWMTCSISRPVRERSERPSALTTPAVTVCWNPYGLPIATTSCPGRSVRESPNVGGDEVRRRDTDHRDVGVRILADEIGAELAAVRKRHRMLAARSTTWLFVRIRPSAAKTNPEPLAGLPARPGVRSALRAGTSMLTTDGAGTSTAWVTAREEASRNMASEKGPGVGAMVPV